MLTKEIMCDYLYTPMKYSWMQNNHRFLLLQVCNTFWLFLVSITDQDERCYPKDYLVTLLLSWKNYNKPRALIKLDIVDFTWYVERLFERLEDGDVNPEKLRQMVDTNDFKVKRSIDKYAVHYGDGKSKDKHIPLLKASGLAPHIDPLEMYLAFEEYFSLEKTASERIYSKDITDKEKIENHGFDTRLSFRGK